MAEEKKEAKPAAEPYKDPFTEIIFFIVAIFVLIYLLNALLASISSSNLFSRGWRGLTPEGILSYNTRPISSLANPINAKVATLKKETSVFSSPGGNKIGSQKFNSRGVILQGPVEIDGKRYWYVDFEEDPDGWVSEDDIGYLEREPSLIERIIMTFYSIVFIARVISVIVSLIFIIFSIYIIRGLTKVRMSQRALMYPPILPEQNGFKNPQWEKIINHIESINENDWRLAIIEADVMLDSLVQKMAVTGDTLGEKLKQIERSDFTSIDLAWEAHKIRNQIAHEGSNFVLTQREARRVIELYRQVFEEFQII